MPVRLKLTMYAPAARRPSPAVAPPIHGGPPRRSHGFLIASPSGSLRRQAARWSGRSVWVFLARGHFAAKTLFMRVGFPWISLDFLGFPWILSSESRLINGLRGIFRGRFFLSLSWREKPERAPAVETIRKGGIVHGASLLKFLIVSNQLSPEPRRARRPRASHSDACGQALLQERRHE
jgi:hypothetical protein